MQTAESLFADGDTLVVGACVDEDGDVFVLKQEAVLRGDVLPGLGEDQFESAQRFGFDERTIVIAAVTQ